MNPNDDFYIVCNKCDIDFDTYDNFQLHHLQHIQQPKIVLSKLSSSIVDKLVAEQFKFGKDSVARKKTAVSPLKISLKKKGKKQVFKVIKEPKAGSSKETPPTKVRRKVTKKKADMDKNLLERFGSAAAGLSIQRTPRTADGAALPEVKQEKPEVPQSNEKLLEKLSGIGGISIGKKNNPEKEETATGGLSVSSKSKTFDIAEYSKKLKEKEKQESGTKTNSEALLAKLSGICGISFASKTSVKKEEPGVATETENKEKEKSAESKSSDESGSSTDSSDEDAPLQPPKKETVTEANRGVRIAKNLFAVKKEELVSEVEEGKPQIQGQVVPPPTPPPTPTPTKVPATSAMNSVPAMVPKVTIKQENTLLDKLVDPKINEATNSKNEGAEKKADDSDSDCDIIVESILPVNTTFRSTIKRQPPEMPNEPSPTPSEQLHPDFIAPSPDAMRGPNNPLGMVMNGQLYDSTGQQITGAVQQESQQPQQQQLAQENGLVFQNLDAPNQSLGNADSTTFWPELNAANRQEGTDPLLTTDNGQSILGSYLTDSIPNDGSEFMSLERLGQGLEQQQNLAQQHQQQQQQQYQQHNYAPAPAPMEQLAQQVQRLQTPPQPNGMPQHHMHQAMSSQSMIMNSQTMTMTSQQMPITSTGAMQQMLSGTQESQPTVVTDIGPVEPVFDLMQGGLTMQQQQQLAQQQQQSQQFDQNQMIQQQMPNLYPAYNVLNQPYTSQAQHQVPNQQQPHVQQASMQPPQFQVPQAIRPPMLVPKPQINARPFQSMAAPRARFGLKRPGQPRMRHATPPKQARANDGGRIMGNSPRMNLTPPRKSADNSKVANALAARGITFTSNRSPQNKTPPRASLPANLNLGPGVSITPSSGNRNRTIVNHNVERPGPCATVDLTMDEEPNRRRSQPGRFLCNQCGKIFTSTNTLEAHKASVHRNNALPYKCDQCSAAYPLLSTLNQHKTTYHKQGSSAEELAIPVVDVSQQGVVDALQRLGVVNYIPLPQLKRSTGGVYGLPIINVVSSQPRCFSSNNFFGAANVFTLGKLKPLSKRKQ